MYFTIKACWIEITEMCELLFACCIHIVKERSSHSSFFSRSPFLDLLLWLWWSWQHFQFDKGQEETSIFGHLLNLGVGKGSLALKCALNVVDTFFQSLHSCLQVHHLDFFLWQLILDVVHFFLFGLCDVINLCVKVGGLFCNRFFQFFLHFLSFWGKYPEFWAIALAWGQFDQNGSEIL